MSSAKTTFAIDDRSTSVVSIAGIAMGIAVVSDRGEPGVVRIITSPKNLLQKYGDPNPKLGTSMYAAKRYLDQGNVMYTSRAVSAAARCAAALVRAKVDDLTTLPVGDISDNSKVILGLDNGISWNDRNSFTFPTYLGNRVYSDPDILVMSSTTDTDKVPVSSIAGMSVGSMVSFAVNPVLADLNSSTTSAGETLAHYSINALSTEVIVKDTVTLDASVSCPANTEILYEDPNNGDALTSYSPKVFVTEIADATSTVVVNNSDLVDPNYTHSINSTSVGIISKQLVDVNVNYVTIDSQLSGVTIPKDAKMLVIEEYEYQDRDSMLVYTTPGSAGLDISVGIEDNTDYDNTVDLVVYLKGIEVERFPVTTDYYINGYGKQMYAEDVINGNSRYIYVLLNPELAGTKPLTTNYAVWLRESEEVFRDTGLQLAEDFLEGDIQMIFANIGDITIGDRIKLYNDTTAKLGEEYKVVSVSGNYATVDRKATTSYALVDGLSVYRFDATYDDAPNGIVDGVKYYAPTKLTKPYPSNFVDDVLSISGISGKLVDTGVTHMLGGSNGNAVTIGEYINAINLLKNRSNSPLQVVCDGGITTPEVAQALLEVAEAQQQECHVYLSNDLDAELSANPVEETLAYRVSLGIDSRLVSLFAGWIYKFDSINQVYVWEPPSIYAINAQSYVTREKTIFQPAAGNVNGVVTGLDVSYKWEEGDLDILVDNNINPIKYESGTITIWGNETLLRRKSPLQLRSVNMLLIALQVSVRSLNEYRLFDFNNESTWAPLEGAVNALIRDDYHAKGGVYDWVVSMNPTDTDINGRKAPLFIGIQPTLDIQQIPTTIAIYSKGADMSA